MKLALAQIDICPGRPEVNFNKILSLYKNLSESVDCVVFPELALPGYFVGDKWEQGSFLRECEELAQALAKQSHETYLIFGSVACDRERCNEDGRIRKYNAAFVAHKGAFLKHPKTSYPFWIKTLSPNYRMFDESRHFFDLRKLSLERKLHPQELLAPLVLQKQKRNFKIALNICEDIWDENYFFSPVRELCKQDVDLILNLSCSPYTFSKDSKRKRIFQKLCDDTQKPILYTNCIGTQNLGKSVLIFDGASAVYRPSETLFKAPSFKESVLVYNTQSTQCDVFGFEYKNDQVYLNTEHFAESAKHDTAELYQSMIYALTSVVNKWSLQNIVVGVSGGIDSALSASLFTKVLGPKSVILVNMPSRFNSQLTRGAASQLAKNLGTSFAEVSIQESFENTLTQLSQVSFKPTLAKPLNLSELVKENIQARDRGARLLAAIASAQGAVFPCNANKTELTVGYCTLYGDASGFLTPLGDLWKHQVYALARYFNEDSGEEIIPQTSLEVVPSAELSSKQDVTKGLGDPLIYIYHDALFKSWVEDWDRKTPEDLLQAFQKKAVEVLPGLSSEEILSFFQNDKKKFLADLEHWWGAFTGMGAFKRVQVPPLLVFSRRSFGMDYKECIGPLSLSRKYDEMKRALLRTS